LGRAVLLRLLCMLAGAAVTLEVASELPLSRCAEVRQHQFTFTVGEDTLELRMPAPVP
jgi:hypothetical protein